MALLIALVLAGATLPGEPRSLPGAAEVLAHVRAVYQACSTYSDTCSFTVSVRPVGGAVALWSHGELSTKFVRGSGLHAEASLGMLSESAEPAYVLASDRGRHRLASYSPGVAQPRTLEVESLEQLVGATLGSTGLQAAPWQYVGSLLLPEQLGSAGCVLLEQLSLEAVEPVNGRPCLRVRAVAPDNAVITMWVDQESWLLSRLTREDLVQDQLRFLSLELHGAINGPVSPVELSFP